MKKAKKLLALVLAAIMIFSVAVPNAFARGDYTSYEKGEGFNSIAKYEFTPEQSATYLLDLVDQMLYESNLVVEEDLSVTTLYLNFTSIDNAVWYLYHVLHGVAGDSSTSCKLVVSSLGTTVSVLARLINLGDLDDLSISSLQVNGDHVKCARCVPDAYVDYCDDLEDNYDDLEANIQADSDLDVLYMLLDFLADNAGTLKKVATNDLDLGTIGDLVIGLLDDDIQQLVATEDDGGDFDGWLKNLLYGSLWYDGADEAPSDWTYDQGVQDLVNWLLITGTASEEDTSYAGGAKSALGANAEAILPGMLVGYDANKNVVATGADVIGNSEVVYTNGGASIGSTDSYASNTTNNGKILADRADGNGLQTYDMGMYQVVANALNGLLNGMAYDLLQELLYDALDIGSDPDEEIMSDFVYQMLVGSPTTPGLIEDLCCDNGAPSIDWSGVENKPGPMVDKLLTWFLSEGGLATFIKIDYNGIEITDNFMSLLTDLLRLVPTLIPMLGISVPSHIARTDLGVKTSDEEHDAYFLTWAERTERTYAEQYVIYTNDYTAEELENGATPTVYYYVGDSIHPAGSVVNTTDSSKTTLDGTEYHNPALIKRQYAVTTSEVWAYIVKILLTSLIDGVYIPDYANSVASVGAYAVASIAAQYLPENNYWDRLDKYYYQYIVGDLSQFVPRSGKSVAEIAPLAWTETMTIGTKEVEVPRGVMDIGAAIGAFFLNGAFDFSNALGYEPSTETDRTFEEYLFEFLLWGLTQYVNLFTGHYEAESLTLQSWTTSSRTTSTTGKSSVPAAWATQVQSAISSMYSSTGVFKTSLTNQDKADIVYGLIDETLFALIPDSWLPTWMSDSVGEANGGTASTSATLFEDWLLNSVMNIDLQKIISLVQANTSSQIFDLSTGTVKSSSTGLTDWVYLADMQNGLSTVLIQLIYKVLGFVFGGNNLLPCYTYTSATAASNTRTVEPADEGDDYSFTHTYYSVFTNPTSVKSFETLLSGESLGTLIYNLLDLLDWYAPAICTSLLPLIMSFMVDDTTKGYNYDLQGKSITYLDSAYASNQFTVNDLKDYYDTFNEEANGHYLGAEDENENWVFFKKIGAAEEAIKDAGLTTSYVADSTTKGDGVTYYKVYFPTSYENQYYAEQAASNFEGAYVYTYEPLNAAKEYKIVIQDNYRDATSNSSIVKVDASGNKITEGTAANTYYTYSALDGTSGKFTVAVANTNSSNGSLRTGTQGEVTYGSGYRLRSREDYSTEKVWVGNRLNNAIEDTSDFISEYMSFVQNDLPNAYGEWLEYFIRMKLHDKNLYDRNGDGDFTNDDDPDVPGSMYPFTADSGKIEYKEVSDGLVSHSLNFADYGANSSYDVIKAAIEYGNNNSVVITGTFAKEIVALALNSAIGTFDIDNLTAEQKELVSSKCSSLGLTYDADKNEISRKAFAFITADLGGATAFGNYQYDTSKSISLVPIQDYVMSGSDENEVRDSIFDAYKEFALNVIAMNTGLYNHYDDMSERAVAAETSSNLAALDTTTLQWVLTFTKNAYIDKAVDPQQTGKQYINKKKDSEGNLVAKYKASSFDEFQQAYEYGKELLDYIDGEYEDLAVGSTKLRQSLITKAYQAILEAYYNLELRTGVCDWENYLAVLKVAEGILDGPLGYLDKTHTASADYGYTEATLANLELQINSAWTYYNNNYESFDDDKQEEVNEARSDIQGVINALIFKQGSTIDIVFADPEKEAEVAEIISERTDLTDEEKALFDGEAFIKNDAGTTGTLKTVYLTGLQEGFGLGVFDTGKQDKNGNEITYTYEDMYQAIGINTGAKGGDYVGTYTYDIDGGDGTNAALKGKDQESTRVQYVAVFFGDLNSDARIDGADKTIYEYYLIKGQDWDDLEAAYRYAADVNLDGHCGYEDVAEIYNHYNDVAKINQNRTIIMESE